MTNHDKFLDAMYGIDERFLSAHIRRKCPTAADKAKRYSAAVIIYAAALVAIAVILPFIIRHGEDPVPTPGNDPVVVETDSTESGETEITEVPEPETLPTESVTFNGCEFSITLDKSHYDLNDTIYATVNLENKGDETIGLYQGYLGDYLDEVVFYENGEERRYYSSDSLNVYAEAIQMRELKPGECITHKVHFTPGSPLDPSMDTAKLESLWEITASVDYFTDYEGSDPDFEKMKSEAVTVKVPHGNGEYVTAETTTEPPATTAPPETTPPPPVTEAPATVVHVTEEPIVSVVTHPPETTETTPTETEPPVEEVITYPEPYISNQTDTSITKTLFGCEYTVTIDKPKYEQGDTVTVVVTLENKGKSKLYFNGYRPYNILDSIYFYVNGRGTIEVSGNRSNTFLSPGEKMSYTKKFDTTEAKLTGVWSVNASIAFSVDGTGYKESIVIEVPHDGVDPDAFSPIELTNPFSGYKYWEEFSGTGEIVIIMAHDTSLNWSSYLNTEYLGFELEKVEPWIDPEDEKEYIAANPNYRSFVSVFLTDKSDEAVVAAINRMYELDLETDFIYTVYPKTPEFN